MAKRIFNYFVPVVDTNNKPLMPTNIFRAFRWVESGKATAFYKGHIWCVRLNTKPSGNFQQIVIGVDPGSKKEGFTVKSESHTYINLQVDAVEGVKEAVETRRNMRRSRRNRNTPCRKPRFNRKRGGIPPSVKARWQWKLRISNLLKKLFPITQIIVEDIAARTTGQRRWDQSFSPLQIGKNWFYSQLPGVITKQGWETAELRNSLGLKKSKNKLSKSFDAHCVDSWVLANFVVGGHTKVDNKKVNYIKPLKFHRRQLHVMVPAKGGKRKLYGGTRSMGFKRGSLVRHKKFGVCYVGGTSNDRISLHDVNTGERLTQKAKIGDCKFLCHNSCIVN